MQIPLGAVSSLRFAEFITETLLRRKLDKIYCVYILTNRHNTVLYTGVTGDLPRRVWEHKEKIVKSFTSRYNVDKLVYYEVFEDAYEAISREKQIKAGSRIKKIDLIEKMNPEWRDLWEDILD
ncbi:GIY-YIG nuclease family protein [candidate division KSB1 bacterium]|nr:GIY-YIG nuclease family protein [candidate division KSB1 bacterium]